MAQERVSTWKWPWNSERLKNFKGAKFSVTFRHSKRGNIQFCSRWEIRCPFLFVVFELSLFLYVILNKVYLKMENTLPYTSH